MSLRAHSVKLARWQTTESAYGCAVRDTILPAFAALLFIVVVVAFGRAIISEGEVAAAWVQAAGGVAALGATSWFAWLERRSADRAEQRAQRAEAAAAAAEIERHNELVSAAITILASVDMELEVNLKLLEDGARQVTASSSAQTFFDILNNHGRALLEIRQRTSDGLLIVRLTEATRFLMLNPISDVAKVPPADLVRLVQNGTARCREQLALISEQLPHRYREAPELPPT